MKVAVIGAGTMGSGIAQAFAEHPDYQALLCDVDVDLAKRGRDKIEKSLNKLVEKQKMSGPQMDDMLTRITVGVAEDAGDCDLIVEAVLEKMDLKKELFTKLDGICKPEALFASNTSSLSITELSAGVGRPVIGMHFFNPAPVMKLIEVVCGLTTPQTLVDQVIAIAEAIGKTPVTVRDSAGFVVNRILVPMINEAISIYAEGIADADDIDAAMKLGANHPLGPLALGDLIGLDVCLAIMEVLHSETGDPKYRAHPLLRKMVRGGALGRKSGNGFYSYGG